MDYNNTDCYPTCLDDADISPVTLSSAWSRVARLILVVSLAGIGSLGNIYMISAVITEDHLRKRGNTFVVNVALADLVISGVVMPASAVVILAGLQATEEVCNAQWSLAILSWLVTVFSLTAVAAENYTKLCLSPEAYAKLTTTRITWIVLSFWIVSSIAAILQYVYKVGPEYCRRKSKIKLYQAIVAILLVALPSILSLSFYIRTIMQVRLAKNHPNFKPPIAFDWDYSLMKTNMYSFFIFILFWLPFGITLCVGSVKYIQARTFYNLAWFALSKSCVNNIIYCLLDRHFRNAYINSFHYCCCKTTVATSRRSRPEANRHPMSEVRVHIIPGYNMYCYTSPQRRENKSGGSSSNKRSHPRPSRSQSREVYQL